MNSIPIKVVDGRPVLIGDVGKVVDSHQIQSNIVRVNGRRQVYIPIYRQPGANTIEIVDAIKDRLQRILQRIRDTDDTEALAARAAAEAAYAAAEAAVRGEGTRS